MYLPTVLLAFLGLASVSAYQTNVIYSFDPDYAGVSGRVLFDYDPEKKSNEVKIIATLNFKRVDMGALTKAEPKCNGKVTEYAWHIHTKWQQPASFQGGSASFAQCAKAITANHYDPYRSCGPASDYVDSPECAGRAANYKCTPDNYKKDPWLCEVGDLSGKFGRFKPNKNGDVSATYVDKNFPTWLIPSKNWNIVVHAVCADATPRIACGHGHMLSHKLQKKKALEDNNKALVVKDEAEEEDEEDDDSNDANDDETENQESYEVGNKRLRISISVDKDGN